MTSEFDQHVRAQWVGKAAIYERSFAALCAGAASALLDAAEVKLNTRVLDVGTGSGTVARMARQRGAVVAAVDAERSMVEATRRHVADVRLGTLPDLPFIDASFDAAVANFVINHVGDPGAAIAGMRRIVGPGGMVAVTIWPLPSPPQLIFADAVRAAGLDVPPSPRLDPDCDFERTEAGLAGLLTDAGLTDVGSRTLAWDHRVDAETWWSGPAGGLTAIGELIANQPPQTVEKIRQEYDRFAVSLTDDGLLRLPVAAILAYGRV